MCLRSSPAKQDKSVVFLYEAVIRLIVAPSTGGSFFFEFAPAETDARVIEHVEGGLQGN